MRATAVLGSAFLLLLSQTVRAQDYLRLESVHGRRGGKLVVALRSEPKTLNPVTAIDTASREVINRMAADLIHINRRTQQTEPALASSWQVVHSGRRYVLHLRRGLKFSDGAPFDANDVVFTFRVYLDETIHSPQRDLLIVGGKPISVTKLDQYTVAVDLAQPYAAAERLFDSIGMLPSHLLEKGTGTASGKMGEVWNMNARPAEMAGMGPFRLREYVPGQRLTLERNPHYWKRDGANVQLPYLDELVFLFVSSEDAQALRFQAGDTDVINRVGAHNFGLLEREQTTRGYRMQDLGPGMEYTFLLFNLNELGPSMPGSISKHQEWFRDVRFRQAVSLAVDRTAMARLAYDQRATPIWSFVPPGNKFWVDSSIPKLPRSLDGARKLLAESGFKWTSGGTLTDRSGTPVEFSLLTSSNNSERSRIAAIVQDDLRQLGMAVNIVPMEFRAFLDRVLRTHDYDVSVMGLVSGDADPTAEMNVWLSTGNTHLWNLGEKKPATQWQAEIDRLMQAQMTEMDPVARKRLFDRVQMLIGEYVPVICLVAPDVLVGARNALGNFSPAVLEHYTLWNVEELYRREQR